MPSRLGPCYQCNSSLLVLLAKSFLPGQQHCVNDSAAQLISAPVKKFQDCQKISGRSKGGTALIEDANIPIATWENGW